MNKEQFLASGLLQQYALGLTNEREEQVVEEYLDQFPDLRQELAHMHAALDDYATHLNIPKPPARTREHVKNTYLAERQSNKFRRLSLALLVLAVASILGNLFLWRKTQELNWQSATSRALYVETRERLENDRETDRSYKETVHLLEHRDTRQFWMGDEDDSNGRAVVYWNPTLQTAKIKLLDHDKFPKHDVLILCKEGKEGEENVARLSTRTMQLQTVPYFSSCERVYLRYPDNEVAVITSNTLQLAE